MTLRRYLLGSLEALWWCALIVICVGVIAGSLFASILIRLAPIVLLVLLVALAYGWRP